jgi:hypothetical protein
VLWAPKGAKVWFGLSIKRFDDLMEREGKKQKK